MTLKRFLSGLKRRKVVGQRQKKSSVRHAAATEALEDRLLLTVDPGDDLSAAKALTLTPGVAHEYHETVGDGDYSYADVDLYEVPLNAGDTLRIDVDAEYLDDGSWYSGLDSAIRVFDSNGFELTSNDAASSPNDYVAYSDPFVSFTPTESGTYYFGVASSDNSYDVSHSGYGYGSYTGDYVLQVLLTSPEMLDDSGYDDSGYDDSGYDDSGYDDSGYDDSGYDDSGYDDSGYDDSGYDDSGYDDSGYDDSGYDDSGYDDSGYDDSGYDDSGYDDSGYDDSGYDDSGYDDSGYDDSGYDDSGYDDSGYDDSGVTDSTPDELPSVIDNGDDGFSVVGHWNNESWGFQGDRVYSYAGDGADSAVWSFNVAPGYYSISASWTGIANAASDAPYVVTDGTNDLQTFRVNQKVASGADFVENGGKFEELGVVFISGNQLFIELRDDGDGNVYADAVRIDQAPATPEISVATDDVHLIDSDGTIDFGHVLHGDSSTRTITVRNIGVAELTLDPSISTSGFSGFSVASGFTSTTLAPGTSTTFDVQLSVPIGTDGDVTGIVSFTSNDDDETTFEVLLAGEAFVPLGEGVMDNGDHGFTTIGHWNSESWGFQGDRVYSYAGDGTDRAVWTFDVAPGLYNIAASWTGIANAATDTPYVVTDGINDLQTFRVNQKVASAADYTESGGNFEELGAVFVSGNQLVVELRDDADGNVYADAIRVARMITENSNPVSAADTYSAQNGMNLTIAAPGVLANDIDADGDPLIAVLDGGPSNGALTLNEDGSFMYLANLGYSGADSFTYVASDGTDSGSSVTVSLTDVGVPNLPPTAVDDSFTILQGSGLQIAFSSLLGNDTDPENFHLSVIELGTPSHGTISPTVTGFNYHPDPAFLGSDSFPYSISDGQGGIDTGIVTITVVETGFDDNDGSGDDGSGDDGSGDDGSGGDGSGDDGSGGDGSGGDGSGGDGSGGDGSGGDGSGGDGSGGDGSGGDGSGGDGSGGDGSGGDGSGGDGSGGDGSGGDGSGGDGSGGDGSGGDGSGGDGSGGDGSGGDGSGGDGSGGDGSGGDGSGGDGSGGDGSGGDGSGGDGSGGDGSGGDGSGGDGSGGDGSGGDLSDAPTAVVDSYVVSHNSTLTVANPGILTNDISGSGDVLSATLVSSPSFGVVSIFEADGSFVYLPNDGFAGTDSFSYVASDGAQTSLPATVLITVFPQPDAPGDNITRPLAGEDVYVVAAGETLVITANGVLANDISPSSQPLTAQLHSGPELGVLNTLLSDGSFQYQAPANFTGTDEFSYTAKRGSLTSDPATVTFLIADTADAPFAWTDDFEIATSETLEVAAGEILVNDLTADFPSLSVHPLSPASHGNLLLNPDGSFEYTPEPGFHGVDSFTYFLTDSIGTSNAATVFVHVEEPVEVTHLPAKNDRYSVWSNEILTVTGAGVLWNDTDDDPALFSAVLETTTSNGSLAFSSNGTFEYVPLPGFEGIDTFTYRVTDGVVDSQPVTVAIHVSPLNRSPQIANALPDVHVEIEVPEQLIDVSGTFVDAEGDLPVITAANSDDAIITVELLESGQLKLEPSAAGTSMITLRATDSHGAFVETQFSVTVWQKPPIIVTTHTDPVDPGSEVTLRRAIELAALAEGPDRIVLDLPDGEDEIWLREELVVDTDIAIELHDSDRSLKLMRPPVVEAPKREGRLLHIAAGTSAQITGIDVDDGDVEVGNGGAILNYGDLTLSRATVSNGKADAGQGGAIYNAPGASLTLDSVTLTGSSAIAGGAVYNAAEASLTVVNSTVSANTATVGGGIQNEGSLELTNATLTANNSGSNGGALQGAGSFVIANTIVAANIGDRDVVADVTSLGSNLIGNAQNSTGFDNQDFTGSSESPLNPVLGPLQGNGGRTATHQLLANSPAIDQGDNSFATESDQRGASRVLDGPESDKTDATATVDIGAFEFGSFFVNHAADETDATPLADGRVDVDSSSAGDQVTLRAAVQELNALAGWTGTEEFETNRMEAFIVFEGDQSAELTRTGPHDDNAEFGDLDVFGTLTVLGMEVNLDPDVNYPNLTHANHPDGRGLNVIQSLFSERAFHVLPGTSFTIDGMNVQGQVATGAEIQSDGYLRGGLIYNDAGDINVLSSQLYSGKLMTGTYTPSAFWGDTWGLNVDVGPRSQGGGIFSRGGDVLIRDTYVSNMAAHEGGGIYLESGTLTLETSLIHIGDALDGGAIYVNTGELLVDDSTLHGGTAYGGKGGQIYNSAGSVHVTNNSRFNPSSDALTNQLSDGPFIDTAQGGNIFNDVNGQLVIDGNSEIAQGAAYHGGGVFNAGSLLVKDVTFKGNWSHGGVMSGAIPDPPQGLPYQGGGAFFNDRGTAHFERVQFREGDIVVDGSYVYNSNGAVTIVDSDFTHRSTEGLVHMADGGGGTTVVSSGLDAYLNVTDSTFTGHTYALNNIIANKHGTLEVNGSTFSDHWHGGAVIENSGAHLFLTSTTDGRGLELAAALNAHQQIALLRDVEPIADFPVPFGLFIGDELVTVTEVNQFFDSVTIERTAPLPHPVSAIVATAISDSQKYITVTQPEIIAQYELPLDVMIDFEAVTITEIEGNIAKVERGRRGSHAVFHAQPVDIWGISGSLSITDSVFAGNRVLVDNGIVVDEPRPSAPVLSSRIHPFATPALVTGSTFVNNRGHYGAIATEISNHIAVPTGWEIEGHTQPGFEWAFEAGYTNQQRPSYNLLGSRVGTWYPLIHASWPDDLVDTLPDVSLYLQNNVFDAGVYEHGDEQGISIPVDDGGSDDDSGSADDEENFCDEGSGGAPGEDGDDQGYDEVPGDCNLGPEDDATSDAEEQSDSEWQLIYDRTPVPAIGDASLGFWANHASRFAPSVVSGGGNRVATDYVGYSTIPEPWHDEDCDDAADQMPTIDQVQTTLVVADPMNTVAQNDFSLDEAAVNAIPGTLLSPVDNSTNPNATETFPQIDAHENGFESGFPDELPFKIRVSHFDGDSLVHEEVLVTDVSYEAEGGNALLTVERGYGTSEAVEHFGDVIISVSRTGFWNPRDTFGSPDSLPIERSAQVVDASGILPGQQTVRISDPRHLPEAPFEIIVGGIERMSVLAVSGNELSVERNHVGLPDDYVHPRSTSVAWIEDFSFQLESTIGPLADNHQPTAHAGPLPGSPLIDSSVNSEIRTSIGTNVSGDFEVVTPLLMAVNPLNMSARLTAPVFFEDLTVRVADTSDLPPVPFLLKVGEEIMVVGHVDTNTNVLSVQRGAYSTEILEHRLTADLIFGHLADATSTSLAVESASELPAVPFIVELNSELLHVTAVDEQTNVLTVERGAYGTPAVSHSPLTDLRHGQVVEVSDASVFNSLPFTAHIGGEIVDVISADSANNIVRIQRGATRTNPLGHVVGAEVVGSHDGYAYGVQGEFTYLTSIVDTETELAIAVAEGFANAELPFIVRVGQEDMLVTAVDASASGTVFTVERGLGASIPAIHAIESRVTLVTDGRTQRVDSDGDGVVENNVGSAQDLYVTVTTTADLPDASPGNGIVEAPTADVRSLRAAITEANQSVGTSVVSLPEGEYHVAEAIDITAHVTIVGTHADATQIVGNLDRLFVVHPDASLRLVNVTVAGGSTAGRGGGVLVDHGELIVENSIFTSNAASTGGAIFNDGGNVSLVNTAVINNIADIGGGIASAGTLVVKGTTFSGNTGQQNAGAIYVTADGETELLNSSVINNVSHSVSGVLNLGDVSIGNTIVDGAAIDDSSQESGPAVGTEAIGDVAGTFRSLGHNIIGTTGPATRIDSLVSKDAHEFTVVFGNPPPPVPFEIIVGGVEAMTVTAIEGDVVAVTRPQSEADRADHSAGTAIDWSGFMQAVDTWGTDSAPIDVLADRLAFNAGPTPTHALKSGSPALGNGDSLVFEGLELFVSNTAADYDSVLHLNEWVTLPSQEDFEVRLFQDAIHDVSVVATDDHRLTFSDIDLVRNPPSDLPVNDWGQTWQPSVIGGTRATVLADVRGVPRSGLSIDAGAHEAAGILSLRRLSRESQMEDGAQGTRFEFTIDRSGYTNRFLSVDYRVSGIGKNPVDAVDFAGRNPLLGTVTFAPGEAQKKITLLVSEDAALEHDEQFIIELVNPSSDAVFRNSHSTGTILNNDAASVRTANSQTTEGSTLTFAATMFGFAHLEACWSVFDGSATIDDGDYLAEPPHGKMEISGGFGAQSRFLITTVDDSVVELDETLSVVTKVRQGDGYGLHQHLLAPVENAVGVILNNDATSILVRDFQTPEEDGPHEIELIAYLWPNPVDSSLVVTVSPSSPWDDSAYQTPIGEENLFAERDSDYLGFQTLLEFDGTLEQQVPFSLSITGDSDLELDETFSVLGAEILSGGREDSISWSGGDVTILNDDSPGIQVLDTYVKETDGGTEVTVEVLHANATGYPVSVDVRTQRGTTGPTEFEETTETLHFNGTASEIKTFSFWVYGDEIIETDETIEVALSNLVTSNTSIEYELSDGVVTVTNDDFGHFKISTEDSIECPDDEAGTCVMENAGAVVFEIQLVGEIDTPVEIEVSTSDLTANDSHYYAPSQKLTFTPDDDTQTFVVVMIDNYDDVETSVSFEALVSEILANERPITAFSPERINIIDDEEPEKFGTLFDPDLVPCDPTLHTEDSDESPVSYRLDEDDDYYHTWKLVNHVGVDLQYHGDWDDDRGDYYSPLGDVYGLVPEDRFKWVSPVVWIDDVPTIIELGDYSTSEQADYGIREPGNYSRHGYADILIDGHVHWVDVYEWTFWDYELTADFREAPVEVVLPCSVPEDEPGLEDYPKFVAEADWTVSISDPVVLTPFESFNYRLLNEDLLAQLSPATAAPAAALTTEESSSATASAALLPDELVIGVTLPDAKKPKLAAIGDVVPLKYGTITVNPDLTVTYNAMSGSELKNRSFGLTPESIEPPDDLLLPELDIFDTAVRYTGFETFDVHLTVPLDEALQPIADAVNAAADAARAAADAINDFFSGLIGSGEVHIAAANATSAASGASAAATTAPTAQSAAAAMDASTHAAAAAAAATASTTAVGGNTAAEAEAAAAAAEAIAGQFAPRLLSSESVELAVSNHQAVFRGDRSHTPDSLRSFTLELNEEDPDSRFWEIPGLDEDEDNPPPPAGPNAEPPKTNQIPINTFHLDAPVYANHDSTYRIDLRNLFEDPDASDALRIVAYASPDGIRSSATEAEVKLGEIDTISTVTGLPISSSEKFLNIRQLSDTVIEITNPLTQEDVNPVNSNRQWDNLPGAGDVSLLVYFTDGQTVLPEMRDHDPTEGQLPNVPVYHALSISVRPNVGTNESVWHETTTAPEYNSRPWITKVNSPNNNFLDNSKWKITPVTRTGSTADSASEAVGNTLVDLETGSFQLDHDIILDGSGGNSEMALPGLVYDSATVQPEAGPANAVAQVLIEVPQTAGSTSLPSTITATLTWYDHVNSAGANGGTPYTTTQVFNNISSPDGTILIAMRPDQAPIASGIYHWEMDLEIDGGVTITTAGQTPVVVTQSTEASDFDAGSPAKWDHQSIFGAGWQLAGVPSLHLDFGPEDNTPVFTGLTPEFDSANDVHTVDDRILLSFPGQSPKIFNLKPLSVSAFGFSGTLDSLQIGSASSGSDGFADPTEFGSLTADSATDEITYDDGFGTEYVFKRFIPKINSSGGERTIVYLIDRIEPVAVETATDAATAKRKAVIFEREVDASSSEYGQLTAIVATDGTKTRLEYTPDGYVSFLNTLNTASGSVERTVELNVHSGHLADIRHVHTNTAHRFREFQYDDGFLVTDRWYSDSIDPANLERYTKYDYEREPTTDASGVTQSRMLTEIVMGDESVDTDAPVVYEITPAAVQGLKTDASGDGVASSLHELTGSYALVASDLAAYSESDVDGNVEPGRYISTYTLNIDGWTTTHAESFERDSGGSVELTSQTWQRDAIGSTKIHTNSEDVKTYYWRDYEQPIRFEVDSNPLVAFEPPYGYEDYRGNLTYVLAAGGMTINKYETDENAQEARRRLIESRHHANVTPNGKIKVDWESASAVHGVVVFETELEEKGDITYYNRRAIDGRLNYIWTVRGEEDTGVNNPALGPDLEMPKRDPDNAESDHYEFWTYDADKLLETHTDARGLKSTYTYDDLNRVETVTVLDSGTDLTTSLDDETTSTLFEYDDAGFTDAVVSYYGDIGASLISMQELVFDVSGRLLSTETTDPAGDVLSRNASTYSADGYVIEVTDGNDVVSGSEYDTAGRLTKTVQAFGETYNSLFAGLDESVTHVTEYHYYADGTLKHAVLPDETNRRFYRDPLNRKGWDTTDRVSSGAHTGTDAGDFTAIEVNLSGVQVIESTFDEFGRVTKAVNNLTGGDVTQEHATFGAGLPSAGHKSGKAATQTDTTTNFDNRGNTLRQQTKGFAASEANYDSFNYNKETADLAASAETSKSTTQAAGDITKFKSSTYLNVGGSAIGTQSATTEIEYDQKGRIRIAKDALTFDSATATGELGTVPSTVNYSFDNTLNLREVVSTSHTGVVTREWFDGLNRLVRSENANGAVTELDYDAAGNLIRQKFTPAAADTTPARDTEFRYDALNRLRVTIEHGADPFFTATDYFLPTSVGGDGWDVVQFNPIDGTDPTDAGNVNGKSTRTTSDSLGNPIFVMGPNEGTDADPKHAATVYTYDYYGDDLLGTLGGFTNPLFGFGVTTRQTVSGSDDFSIDSDHEDTRITRTINDIHGNPSLIMYRTEDPSEIGHDSVSSLLLATVDLVNFDILRFDQYNENNLLTSSRTPVAANNGLWATTTYDHDIYGNVETVHQADGSTLKYRHYSDGQIRSEEDARGNVTRYTYDVLGRPETITRPTGHATEYEYRGETTIVREYGGSDIFESSSTHNVSLGLKTDIDAEGNTTKSKYDSAGNVIWFEDGRGHKTHYEYDRFNRLVKTTDARNSESTIEYDAAGNVKREVDVLGRITEYEYDNRQRILDVIDPVGGVTSFQYDISGNKLSETYDYDGTGRGLETYDAISRSTTYEYNRLNQLEKTTVAAETLNLETTQTYDLAGNLESVTDPEGNTTTFEYDEINRQTKVIDPLLHETTTEYIDNGGTVKVTNHLNHVTTTHYDEAGRVESVEDAEGGITDYVRDAFGNLRILIDPENNETTFTYDALHRVTSNENENGDTRKFFYDENGNREFQIDRNGRITQYKYDELNRLKEERWIPESPSAPVPSDGPTESWGNAETPDRILTFDYDLSGRTVAAGDVSASYSYAYTLLNGLKSSTSNRSGVSQPVTQTATFDAIGNRTALDIEINSSIVVANEYAFDTANRLDQITQSGSDLKWKQIDITYDGRGLYGTVSRYINDDSTLVGYSDFNFDEAGRLQVLDHFGSDGGTQLAGYAYTHDEINRITGIDSFVDGNSTFTYDKTDQLKTADFTGQDDESYTYDENGNRTNAGYETGDNNRLDSDGTYNYAYDAEGNRTERKSIAETDGKPDEHVKYTWDFRNRLTHVTFRDHAGDVTKLVSYVYDVFDRRISKRVADGDSGTADHVERYLYEDSPTSDLDGIALVQDDSGNVTSTYLHGPDVDQVFAEETGDGEVFWNLTDHQGTVRDIVEYDESTDVTDVEKHIKYGAFGNILEVTDSSGSEISDGASEITFAYTDREWDEDAQLYYYRARWYDGEVGRFVSEDPMGFDAGDANLNRYVGNRTYNSTDPSGLYDAAGHFYTTYIAAHIVTGDAEYALKLAYYSQLPDIEVDHEAVPQVFTAKKLELQKAQRKVRGWFDDLKRELLLEPRINGGLVVDMEDIDIKYAQQINGILHALHGGEDVDRWRDALQDMVANDKTLQIEELGYVIHTFADSFAHTFENGKTKADGSAARTAFGWWIGHGAEVPAIEVLLTSVRGWVKDVGHEPDIIPYHPKNYDEYLGALTEAIAERHGVELNEDQQKSLEQLRSVLKENFDGKFGKGDGGAQVRELFYLHAKENHALPELIDKNGRRFLAHKQTRAKDRRFATPTRSTVEELMDHIYGAIYGPGEDSNTFLRRSIRNERFHK